MVNNFNFSFFCDSPESCNNQVNDSDIQMLTNITATLGPINLNNFQLSKPVIVKFEIDKVNNIIELDSVNNIQEVTFTIVAIDNGEIKNVRLKKGNEIIKDNLEELENKYTFKKTFKFNDYNTSNTYETYSVEAIDNFNLKTERLLTINVKKVLPPVISKFISNKTDNQVILTSINQTSTVIFDIEIKENDGNIISNDRITNVKVKKGNNIIENNLTMSQNKYTFAQLYQYNDLNAGLNEELYEVIATDNKNQMITKNLIFKIIKDTPPIISSFESNTSNNKIELTSNQQSKNVLFTIEVNDNNGELISTNSINSVMIRHGSNVLINNIIINSDKKYTYTKTYNYNLYSMGDTIETLQAVVSDNRGQITTKDLVLTINKAPPPPPPGLLYTHYVEPNSKMYFETLDGTYDYYPKQGEMKMSNIENHLGTTNCSKTHRNATCGKKGKWNQGFIKRIYNFNGRIMYQFYTREIGSGFNESPGRIRFIPKNDKKNENKQNASFFEYVQKDGQEWETIYLSRNIDCWNTVRQTLNTYFGPGKLYGDYENYFKKPWADAIEVNKKFEENNAGCKYEINDPVSNEKSYYYHFDSINNKIEIYSGVDLNIPLRGGEKKFKNIKNINIYDIYSIFKNSFINKDNNSSFYKYIENLTILNKDEDVEFLKFLYKKASNQKINNKIELKRFLMNELDLTDNKYFMEYI